MAPDNPVQIVKDVLRNIPTGNETVFDLARETGEDGKPQAVLKVIQRRVNPEPPPMPVKAPSPRRQHEFYATTGLIGYLAKYGNGNTVVLADPETETVTAIMDNAAADGFEIVTFKPQVHPVFAPWKKMVEGDDEDNGAEYLPIRQMVDFLSENRRAIIGAGGAKLDSEAQALLQGLRQLKVCRKVEMMQGVGNQSINGIMVELNIAGKVAENKIDLPETIVVEAPLYVGRAERQFVFDLTLNASEQTGVVARLSPGDLLAQRAEEFDLIVAEITASDRLAKLVEAGMVIGLGRPNTQEWAYLAAPRSEVR